jgi:peptide/nickel transport system ATP-binding protein
MSLAVAPAEKPLLRVEGLNVAFSTAQGTVEAVRDISFQIAAGEILALVGESGSGKSVTARALVGLAGPSARVEAQALSLAGRDAGLIDLRHLSAQAWRQVRGREIGFVLQDALVSLDPLRTVGREVAEPILAHDLQGGTAVAQTVETLLLRVGIPDPQLRAAQYPHELSGGLRQRALIASAIAAQPRLLIADEPTTALDVTIQQQVLSVFGELARAGHGILLITHDLAVAAQIAGRVAVMQDGRLVELGPAREVLFAPRHAYTRRLLAAVPSAASRGRWLSATGGAPPRSAAVAHGPPLLELRNVSVAFKRPDGGRLDAVRQVSLCIRQGETLGIVGESGSGKTTLGKVALALRRPDSGEVLLDGEPWSILTESARRPLRQRIQTIVQDPLGSFDPRFTVERIIEQPLRLRAGLDRAARRHRIGELIELVGLHPDLLARRPGALSGGQRQRVSIAQALAAEPELLVCDEPVSALDVTTQAQVLDLLVALQRRLNLAMMFISHDLGVIQHMSHRIAVMKAGEIVETGSVEQVFDAPRDPYTRCLLAAVPQVLESTSLR